MSSAQSPDVRWKQRLQNFEAAYSQFKNAVDLSKKKALSDLEKQGLIQAFEFTHELSWKVLKDYFDFQGGSELITGSRDATREAFKMGVIKNGEVWMEMISSRNQTSHTYNKKTADEIIESITTKYSDAFEIFLQKLKSLSDK